MGTWVVPEAVENRYGPFTEEQRARLPWLIADAEEEIGQGRDLATRIDDGRTTVGLLVRVVGELVNEVMRNPMGLRAHSQTTGSFTDQQTFAGDATAEVALSTRHRRMLGDPAGGTAFTIDTTPARAARRYRPRGAE